MKPNIPQQMQSRSVLLKNMFDPEKYVLAHSQSTLCLYLLFFSETEKDWDKDLAEDVKGECEYKYGKVEAIKVEKESQVYYPLTSAERALIKLNQGEIYVKFDSIDSAKNAIQGLNGRWFGGNQVSANFISDAIMQAHQ